MPFGSLWLPVVLSAVAVFLVSSIVHMALRYHRADYRKLADEEPVAAALRKIAPAPGLYFIPHCTDMAQMKEPAMVKRFEEGPVGLLTIRPNGMPGMGKSLAQWFLFSVFVSFVVAYVARHTLQPGSPGLEVMRITGSVAFAAYAMGYVQDSIWKSIPWSNSLRGILDACFYALATGLVFRCFWPAA
jgi:hypothetical protein